LLAAGIVGRALSAGGVVLLVVLIVGVGISALRSSVAIVVVGVTRGVGRDLAMGLALTLTWRVSRHLG